MEEEGMFHVLGENDTLLRFKRNKVGKISHVDTVKAIRVDAKPSPAPGSLLLEDRIAFFCGVLGLLALQFLVLRLPHLVPPAYAAVLLGLLALRVPLFLRQKEGLFLIDFCYFMNISTIVQIFFYPENTTWFNANYVLCMGCLMNAMVVWQNVLMLHSVDRITSLLLHALAPLTLHLLRWERESLAEEGLGLWEAAVVPMALYTVWQVAYLAITEVLLAGWLAAHPDQTFSLRYLASDTTNEMHQLVKTVLRAAGLLGRAEEFDASTAKTKLIFVGAQLVYTLATLGPVPFLYSSYTLSQVYIGGIWVLVVWRGAAVYMEDWAVRRGVALVWGPGAEEHREITLALGHQLEGLEM